MVGKLMKYDFMSFFRLLLPVQLIIIGIAAINRIIQIFESSDTSAYHIAFVSSIVLLVISCLVALVMTVVIAIVRFYQGLYSKEGYLSHTLPVTPAQHILSKLLVSVIFEIGTVFSIFLALNVALGGEVALELYKAGFFLFGKAFGLYHVHVILFIIELVLGLLTQAATFLLTLYFCISIGQLANRRKILLAFGVFFGLYVAVQILLTIFIILGIALSSNPGWLDFLERIVDWASEHLIAWIHIIAWISIILNAVIGFVFFLVSKTIMTKRLNLN